MQASAAANASPTSEMAIAQSDLRFLRAVLGAQVVLGLLWGVSMLFFAPAIVLGDPSGPP